MAATVIIGNPHILVTAPNVGFTRERLDKIGTVTGVVAVEGVNQRSDGTFEAVRVFFASNDVMETYLAGWAPK